MAAATPVAPSDAAWTLYSTSTSAVTSPDTGGTLYSTSTDGTTTVRHAEGALGGVIDPATQRAISSIASSVVQTRHEWNGLVPKCNIIETRLTP